MRHERDFSTDGKTDKELMREGRYAAALGNNYSATPYGADIWLGGWDDCKNRKNDNMKSFCEYSSLSKLREDVEEFIKDYPGAYVVYTDLNADWM